MRRASRYLSCVMRARVVAVLLLGVGAGLGLVACGRSSSSGSGGAPAPLVSGAASAAATAAASAVAPSVASAAASASATTGGSRDVYVGAVGGALVRATLSMTTGGLDGRWVYVKTGSAGGLKLTSVGPPRSNRYVVRESTDRDETTGELELEGTSWTLSGTWHEPTKHRALAVLLTREERSRHGDTVVQARPIAGKPRDPATSAGVGFVPVLRGPLAASLNAKLTLKKLLDEDDSNLDASTTALDFTVLHHDDRILTLSLVEETMGAYPSSHGVTASFDLRAGTRLGREIFVHDRAKLAKKLDAKVHAAWRDKKRELTNRPDAGDGCGADVAESFMSGDGPSFTVESLDTVFADVKGLHFGFGFDFPHAVLACAPEVDLSMPWAEAKPYLDPAGPLATF